MRSIEQLQYEKATCLEDIKEMEAEQARVNREHKASAEVIQQMQERQTALKDRRRYLNQEIETRHKQLREIEKELLPPVLVVTDHVVLRYIERHLHVDTSLIRQKILEDLSGVRDVSDVRVRGFVIQNGKIVTYIPQEGDAQV